MENCSPGCRTAAAAWSSPLAGTALYARQAVPGLNTYKADFLCLLAPDESIGEAFDAAYHTPVGIFFIDAQRTAFQISHTVAVIVKRRSVRGDASDIGAKIVALSAEQTVWPCIQYHGAFYLIKTEFIVLCIVFSVKGADESRMIADTKLERPLSRVVHSQGMMDRIAGQSEGRGKQEIKGKFGSCLLVCPQLQHQFFIGLLQKIVFCIPAKPCWPPS